MVYAQNPSWGTKTPRVKTGIEVLKESNFAILKSKRVGLLTNPSGVDANMVSTIEILHNAKEVNLVALYGPEHGVRGDKWAGEKAADSIDELTSLPVYSLYGHTRKPTKEMLQGVDVLVYDIQDVGTRSYTYISTLGLAMQVCAEMDIEVIVLDRPNPLGGIKVEGPYVEPQFNSFVSQYKIPYIYGLTVGELALMINEEGLNCGQKGDETPKKCRLTVVPMSGWERSMNYKDTGLQWVPSSPNIPSADAAIAYSCSGVCGEIYSFLNVGIGYTLPFQLFGAEWINANQLKAKLDSYNIPGVAFKAIWYKPFYGSGAGKTIQGVHFFFTEYEKAPLTTIQFYIMQAIAELYPNRAAFDVCSSVGLFDKVCGTDYVRINFGKTNKVESILNFWMKDVSKFKNLSQKYYLY